LVLDFVFPVVYAALLSGLYQWAARRVGATVHPALVGLPWVAAGLDYFENVATIGLLVTGRPVNLAGTANLLVFLLSSASALKWTAAIASLVLTAVTAFSSAFGRVLWICRYGFLSVALVTLSVLVVPQGQDVLRGLVEVQSWSTRALSFAFLLAWASSVWYWSRVLLMIRLGWTPPPPVLQEWVPRCLGALACIGFGMVCFAAARTPGKWDATLIAYGLACLALGGAFLFGVYKRRAAILKVAKSVGRTVVLPPATATFDWRQLPAGTKAAFVLTVALSAVFFIVFTFSLAAARLGTLSVIFLVGANAVFIGSTTVFAGRILRVPVVAIALALAALFSLWNDNHVVRLSPEPSTRKPLADVFRGWIEARQREHAAGEAIPLILVAAEGGGLRAAYWTGTALGRIQDRAPGFARHVFAISGVSGGSLGAAVFAALVDKSLSPASQGAAPRLGPCGQAAENRATADVLPFEACASAALSENFLAPTLGRMLSSDFAQWFSPVPLSSLDRAHALEDSWAAAYERATGDDELSRGFLDLSSRHPYDVPTLMLNVTHVESGRRLIETSFTWERPFFPDAYDLLRATGVDIPLKTAVHNSARFAYVSPAGRLQAHDGSELGRVVDGGYFENSGAVSLLDLKAALQEMEPGLIASGVLQSPIRYHTLYLCNNPLRCGLKPVEPGALDPSAPAGVSDLLAPLRSLLSTREARGSLALANLSASFSGEYTAIGACPVTPQEERKAPLPLGWQLSKEVRDRLSEQLRRCVPKDACGPTCLAPQDNAAAIEKLERLLSPPQS
jgi:hypothetical protein